MCLLGLAFTLNQWVFVLGLPKAGEARKKAAHAKQTAWPLAGSCSALGSLGSRLRTGGTLCRVQTHLLVMQFKKERHE